jgi:hypothetical protein
MPLIGLLDIMARVSTRNFDTLVSELPLMKTTKDRIVAAVSAEMMVLGYLSDPALLTIMGTRSILQSFDRGLAPPHCFMYLWYAFLAGSMGDVKMGYQFAGIGEEVADKTKGLRYRGPAMQLMSSLVFPWHRPWKSFFPLMDAAFALLLQCGDIQWAGCKSKPSFGSSYITHIQWFTQ